MEAILIEGSTQTHDGVGACILAVGRISPGGVELCGTAFAVSEDRLATAAHVVGVEEEGLVGIVSKAPTLSEYQDTTDKKIRCLRLRIVSYDSVRDIAILNVQDAKFRLGYSLFSTDDVDVGGPVVSLGYPHADHGRLVLTAQESSVGARVFLGDANVKTKHIVLNTQCRPGQSGGPVFRKGGKLGVAAMILGSYAPSTGGGISLGGIDPQTLHQTTHAISAEYIRSML